MQAHRRHRQVVLLTELTHLHKVYKALHVLLHLIQPDQRVKLCKQLFKARLLLLRLRGLGRRRLPAGGLLCGRVLLREARLHVRDEVQRIERLLRLLYAGGIAYRGQLVAALGDILGLGIAHVVVRGGEVEQNVGEHTDECA